MKSKIIKKRLEEYKATSRHDEINAIKEISQEIILSVLAKGNFFKNAAFQGGTCLHLVYGMERFSEDLDFILKKPDNKFVWEPFLKLLEVEFASYGFHIDVQDRSKVNRVVKAAFLKEDSFGKLLKFEANIPNLKPINIKLEVDTNPPEGSNFENHFLDFPYPFSIITQDLPSLFASKCHALLCRRFIKGRDWFDFVWYVSKKAKINYYHLSKALAQMGPWKDKDIEVTKSWLKEKLKSKIKEIDWNFAKKDVDFFLSANAKQSLNLWDGEFFNVYVDKLV